MSNKVYQQERRKRIKSLLAENAELEQEKLRLQVRLDTLQESFNKLLESRYLNG